MVDFFNQQDQARRNTSLLVVLFLFAVGTLIALTNLLVMLALWGLSSSVDGSISGLVYQGPGALLVQFDWQRFGLISLGVGATVFCAILYRWLQLAEGGKAVAESLGGQRIQPNTDDPEQRQALNLVEEMAIASGMPVPPVYLLPLEFGINAFAAGNTPADAVIGLTQGCIERLDRPQLQGVIAHEFSHILNGDMRLNLRLIAILYGIVFIGSIGELMLRVGLVRGQRSSKSAKGRLGVFGLGLGLMMIGWLGTLFGKLIKASVSRQREFLADASAVQFTRNPQGIADAFKVIGGHQYGAELLSPASAEVSHLFFGQSFKSLSGLFATHPPLLERILRLEPDWDGSYIYPRPSEIKKQQQQQQVREQHRRQQRLEALQLGVILAGGPADLLTAADTQATIGDSLPANLHAQAQEPLGAMALVLCLLLFHKESSQEGNEEEIRNSQWRSIGQLPVQGILPLCQQLLPDIQKLPRSLQMPLAQLCLPALKCLSLEQYQAFKKTLLRVIRADRHTDLFEWCLYQVVRHYLAPEFEKQPNRPAKYSQPQQVSQAYLLVVSLLAHQGHTQLKDAERAFNRAVTSVGLYNLRLLPDAECELNAFIQAVNRLAASKPLLKQRLLKGLTLCARQDKQITPIENEIIASIAAIMDCPQPLLTLNGSTLNESTLNESILN
ncbi:MAG: Zn-dependent protease with chaperone function [Motiliproteus sp.]|jgi:Zn-dependent protease with chaperone function